MRKAEVFLILLTVSNIALMGSMVYLDFSFAQKLGKYNTYFDKITLNVHQGTDLEQVFSTNLHELCHHIWFDFTDEGEKQEYRDYFNQSDKFISGYASTDVVEDFAESCQFYLEGKVKRFGGFYKIEEPKQEFLDELFDKKLR